MKIARMVLAALAMVALVGTTIAADDVKKALVGKWEAVKADEGTLPVGSVVEFTADGKLKIAGKKEGKDVAIDGTYTVDGSAFTYKLSVEGKEKSQKITVKLVNDTELDTVNEEGKKVTFKKVK